MVLIYFLKMLADLAAYYMFAAPAAAYFGGGTLILCLLLQAVAYGLYKVATRKWVQLLCLLPAALCFAVRISCVADLLALIPSTVYLLRHALGKSGPPDLYHQRDLLHAFLKPLFPAIVLALFCGGITRLLPFCVIWLVASVILLRTLRHKPEVYLQPRFQVINLAAIVGVFAVTGLLSFPPLVRACSAALKWVYDLIINPILTVVTFVPLLLSQLLLQLLSPIFSIEPTATDSTDPYDAAKPYEQSFEWPEASQARLEALILVLFVLVALIIAIAVLRWISKRQAAPRTTATADTTVRSQLGSVATATTLSENAPTTRIRKEYRKYLRRCSNAGMVLEPGTTSDQVEAMASEKSGLSANATPIRQLYIRARYAGTATRVDAGKMARLCAQSKVRKAP